MKKKLILQLFNYCTGIPKFHKCQNESKYERK